MKPGSLELCVLLPYYSMSNVLPLAFCFCRVPFAAAVFIKPSPSWHLTNAEPELPQVQVCLFFWDAHLHTGAELQGRNIFENTTFIKLVRKFRRGS